MERGSEKNICKWEYHWERHLKMVGPLKMGRSLEQINWKWENHGKTTLSNGQVTQYHPSRFMGIQPQWATLNPYENRLMD